ncbi:hypothetical protein FIBSPDRAFT_198602 [Athelia psychrophila]|uniref:Uncharacterized protein n=1 Tax=Athelia psychrophila TaxID=1759441 RepID=A0A165ZS45_9AGAM|nr:hypothetical protein FIBSPDRAFT_198602 [Fibularhizoctonia sp. CBS 109695]
MHAVWDVLLDEQFINAHEHDTVVECRRRSEKSLPSHLYMLCRLSRESAPCNHTRPMPPSAPPLLDAPNRHSQDEPGMRSEKPSDKYSRDGIG